MEKLEIKKLLARNFCPICGGKYNVRDNVKTVNSVAFEILNLKECINCGHWWIDPLPIQDYLKTHLERVFFVWNQLLQESFVNAHLL